MANELHLTYVGHATALIEMDGIRLLTDPILRSRVMHLRRNTANVDEAWHQNIDAVLVSHMHYDHLDLPSLEMLGKETHLIVPNGMGPMLQRRGFTRVEELTVDGITSVGSVKLRATRADHDRARFRGGPTADALGFVINGTHTVYFPGDTDLFPEMSELAENLDVALIPVWGWGPTLGKGHLDPYRAALSLQMLKPKVAIPIHWGTLYPFGMRWLKPGFLFDPPHTFANFAAEQSPDVTIKILQPGEAISFDESEIFNG